MATPRQYDSKGVDVERVGESVVLAFDSGITLILGRGTASTLGSALMRVAAGPDSLDGERPGG